MFKKTVLKNFILCTFFTVLVNMSFLSAARFKFSLPVISVIVIISIITALFALYVFKKQFLEESEVRIKDLKHRLEYNSSHLATIIDNLPLIAFIIDKNYKFITGNTEALKFFDIKEEGQLSKLSVDIFERDTMELIKEENNFIIKNQKVFVTDRLVKLKSGKQNWFRVRKIPIFNQENKVNGFVVFKRNIDDEKAAQKQRETYISTLSHDLKIPTLAQIRALELLVGGKIGTITSEQKEILDLTLESCYCMYDMLSTILSTYKYENNDVILNYEKIQMLKLLDECFTKSYKSMRHKNITVKVKAKDKFISLYADKSQIKKAFEILIDYCVSNAYENSVILCEITKKDSDKIFISLGFESPYVSSDYIGSMFNKYTTSSLKLDKVGSSLGLYLSKQIINAHNGTINVESMESNYNTYKIEVPCINECKLSAVAC